MKRTKVTAKCTCVSRMKEPKRLYSSREDACFHFLNSGRQGVFRIYKCPTKLGFHITKETWPE